MTYLAVVRMTVDQDYCVEFPDFPGVERRCASIPEAQRKAVHALRDALAGATREGRPAPEPTLKHELESRPEYRSSFVVQVKLEGAELGG